MTFWVTSYLSEWRGLELEWRSQHNHCRVRRRRRGKLKPSQLQAPRLYTRVSTVQEERWKLNLQSKVCVLLRDWVWDDIPKKCCTFKMILKLRKIPCFLLSCRMYLKIRNTGIHKQSFRMHERNCSVHDTPWMCLYFLWGISQLGTVLLLLQLLIKKD